MSRKFIIAIVTLLLVVFLIEYRMPRHFVWDATFGHTDAQPFGCQLFDSALAVSMPEGYTVSRQSLWQMQRDSTLMARPHGIVILTGESRRSSDVSRQVIELAQRGHVLLVAASTFALGLEDTLDVTINWNSHFSTQAMTKSVYDRDTLSWVGPLADGRPSDSLAVAVTGNLLEWSMTVDDSLAALTLIQAPGSLKTFAAAIPMGKGEIIIVSSPLLMTNYGMLHSSERLLIGRLLSRMSRLPVVRTVAYVQSTAFTEETPFYVFLQQPPLRWAVYLALLTLLLFMVLTARRRQRVIPVMAPPVNRNLEFVRHVGTLYYQQADHRGLVARKLTYAADEIRRLSGIDILEEPLPSEQLAQLSRLTGLTADELRLRLANAREATTGHHVVTPEEMQRHVDNLNEIVRRVT